MIDLLSAQALFRDLSDSFNRCGWTLAMFGSTLKNGRGNDIDLIAVPCLPRGGPQRPDSTLMRAGITPSPDPYYGFLQTEAHKVEHNGLIIDIQFRLSGTGHERDETIEPQFRKPLTPVARFV